MNPFLGQLALVPYNVAPLQWAFCQGQLLPISQYTALFALLGTQFGGNGTSNFGLPDLQGRIPLGQGQAVGGSDYIMGDTGGDEMVTLNTQQVQPHAHNMQVYDDGLTSGNGNPANSILTANLATTYYAPGDQFNKQLNAASLSVQPPQPPQPHENRMPYLVLNWIIAMQGVFPPRS